MTQLHLPRIPALRLSLLCCSLAGTGCGGAITHQTVQKQVGSTYSFGAPKDLRYSSDVQLSHDALRVTLYQESLCDKFAVALMQVTELTKEGGRITREEPLGVVQKAGEKIGTDPCERKYARDVEVSIKVGAQTVQLGKTSATGEIFVNLTSFLKQALYGDAPAETALLYARGPEAPGKMPQEIATLSLAQLNQTRQRTEELIAQFQAVLAKGYEGMTADDVSRGYEIYEQLGALAPFEPRVRGLRQRLIETLWERRQLEKSENLKRNMDALAGLKDVLGKDTTVVVPAFVRLAVNDGDMTPDTLSWAEGQTALGFAHYPALCAQAVTWTELMRLSSGPTRVALGLLQYEYGDPYLGALQTLCERTRRFR